MGSSLGRLRPALGMVLGGSALVAGLVLRVHSAFGPFSLFKEPLLVPVIWVVFAAVLFSAWVARPRFDRGLDWGFLPLAAGSAVAMMVLAELRSDHAAALRIAGLETAGGFALMIASLGYLRARARRLVRSLGRSAKSKVQLLDAEGAKGPAVAPDEVTPGLRFVLKAGADVPVDGVIEKGSGFVDETVIVGPSAPVARREGHVVYEGTTTDAPELTIRAMAPRGESLLSQVERQTAKVADALMETSVGARGWSMVGALIVMANVVVVVLLAELPAVPVWLPSAASLFIAAPLGAAGLALVVGRLEALALVRKHGLFVSRQKDLVALTGPHRFLIDPMLVVAPGSAEAVALADVPPATILSVAAALCSASDGPEYPILRHALHQGGLVTAQAAAVSRQHGVWTGTVDGLRWFMGARGAIEQEKSLALSGAELPPVGFLEDRSSFVLMVGRENEGLVGAIGLQVDAEPEFSKAARRLKAVLLPEFPDAIREAIAKVSGLMAHGRPLNRRDVSIIREGSASPSAGTRIRLLSRRVPTRLADEGSPRVLQAALPGLTTALVEVATAAPRMGTRTTFLVVIPPVLSAILAHLSLLSPALAALIGLATLLVAGSKYGLSVEPRIEPQKEPVADAAAQAQA